MAMPASLTIRVNDELMLDAGTCEEVAGTGGPELLIRPPRTTLFRQVLAYLRKKPDPTTKVSGSTSEREGVAACAMTLRWGSFLSVLLDREKSVWSEVKAATTSRISDEEMARINIEASSALAEWVDLFRTDQNHRLYFKLVDRAVCYLPMPKRKPKINFSEFLALANPEISAKLLEACEAGYLERARTDAERFASRIFANALTNHAWRNGPVEGIHGGQFRGYPLDQRRVTPGEERELMVFASERLAIGMRVCRQFSAEQPPRAWSEQVVPYALAEMLLITPSRWTLTESSRQVRLPESASPGAAVGTFGPPRCLR
jgi:hypothetical protein